jgi:hypothetical protein
MPIWYQFYPVSNQLRSNSILIQFDLICTSCDVLLLFNSRTRLIWFDLLHLQWRIIIILNPNNVRWMWMKYKVTWHRGAIRSDSIAIRSYFDWIGIWYQFNPISNQLWFDSILIQFGSICTSCDVFLFFFLLLLLLLLLNLFHCIIECTIH